VQSQNKIPDLRTRQQRLPKTIPSPERETNWVLAKKAMGYDIFFVSWKGLKMVMNWIIREKTTFGGAQSIQKWKACHSSEANDLCIVDLAYRLHCVQCSLLCSFEGFISQKEIYCLGNELEPLGAQLAFMMTQELFPSFEVFNKADDLDQGRNLKHPEGKPRYEREKHKKILSKQQTRDFQRFYWWFHSWFTFQPACCLPKIDATTTSGASSTQAQKLISRSQWLPRCLYKGYESPCIDGHLLCEAIIGRSIEDSVDALLLLLVKCRLAEDAKQRETELPLQCYLAVLELATGMILLGLGDNAIMPSHVANALQTKELKARGKDIRGIRNHWQNYSWLRNESYGDAAFSRLPKLVVLLHDLMTNMMVDRKRCDSQRCMIPQSADRASMMQSDRTTKGPQGEWKYLMQRAYLLCGIVAMNLLVDEASSWQQHKQACIFVINRALEKTDLLVVVPPKKKQQESDSSKKGPLRSFTSFMGKIFQLMGQPNRQEPQSTRKHTGGPIRQGGLDDFTTLLSEISKCVESGIVEFCKGEEKCFNGFPIETIEQGHSRLVGRHAEFLPREYECMTGAKELLHLPWNLMCFSNPCNKQERLEVAEKGRWGLLK